MTVDVSYLNEAKRLCSMFERDYVNIAVQLERNDLLRRLVKALDKPKDEPAKSPYRGPIRYQEGRSEAEAIREGRQSLSLRGEA